MIVRIKYIHRVVLVVIYMRLIGGMDSRGSVIEILRVQIPVRRLSR